MCKHCLKPICPSGCPNAEEAPIVEECEYCKEGIHEGDRYLEIEDIYLHEDCLSDMSSTELAELIGGVWKCGDSFA